MADKNDYIQPITGFPEWLPGEKIVEQRFIDVIRRTYEAFGYSPIETPAVERDITLESKGEINKQIYSLWRPNVPQDVEKETGLSLHFDLTVPLARYVAQYYGKLVFPFRRYQIQKVWRGERAQKGRFREFYQCDIDIIGDGSLDLLADAEMPQIIYQIFSKLNIGKFIICISNRKILQGFLAHYGIQNEQAEETVRAIDRLPKLKGGWEELKGFLEGDLSLSGDTVAALKILLFPAQSQESPLEGVHRLAISNERFKQGLSELDTLLGYLRVLDIPTETYKVDLSITRGLDYYTGTVYETFIVGHEKTFGSVCSGGRYDDLASHFIDRKLPGVGVSIGLSRLFATLLERKMISTDLSTPAEVMVTVPERSRLNDSLEIAQSLRNNGLNVELFVQDQKHDKQLRAAVRKGIPFAVIPWPEKLDDQGIVELRNLLNGERENVFRHEVASVIRFVLEKWGRTH